ncbi:hypothetical protein [Cellulomonas fimi]|uniref:Putative lipoprotein n=1 Tax=Cellulomonas fimi (strain ATCC 484 / DSM 20113 / JCM 1341 / CCUG 24087 / LMG 16345 / NBRC 15513 / NCIMB 8980 / NCTC 7547 / NRS-133) TaxID=590998 RepID=F4GY67_CELFA|nr:hypothetical protein [Cellulomonas fimi]AEE44735.1 putative lipoprotein [Cellulomonas fimi ATCC 484]VEH27148.1 Uncharacterised protein [Cellulomonas fimi]
MTSPRTRSPRLLALTGVVAAGLLLSGCSATNPLTTQDEYSASDGVRVTLGDVRASNLLVLSAAEGEIGVLHGALINDGDQDETVTLTFEGAEPTTVELPGGATVLLDGSDDEGHADVPVDAVAAPPGGTVPLTVATASSGAQTLEVPVLDGTLPEYAGALPTATPTPTPEPTPAVTEAVPGAEPTPSPTAEG